MRRSRRLGHGGGGEFGSSGEDSFVAVVVTKLTGALLFILLLAMVIMALLPKAMDQPASQARKENAEAGPLEVVTPERLPEAIAGRPYALALAAKGGHGPLRWAVDGPLPKGLAFDSDSGQIQGTPKAGTPTPAALVLRVSDGSERATRATELVVYQSDQPLSVPSRWEPGLPPIPWQAWLQQGFGFLILLLVHSIGINTINNLERWAARRMELDAEASEEDGRTLRRRFGLYRTIVRLATVFAAVGLAYWLWSQKA
jgi:hypothetical protein